MGLVHDPSGLAVANAAVSTLNESTRTCCSTEPFFSVPSPLSFAELEQYDLSVAPVSRWHRNVCEM